MDIKEKQSLYKQYLMLSHKVLDKWFALKILYSKLANSYDAMHQKFFEKPELKQFGKTLRYCIIKQYKPIMSDVFAVLNKDFSAGREFSEPLFVEKSFCEYYMPEKMCIVNGCAYYPFNKQYFDNLQNFQSALHDYHNVLNERNVIYNKMLNTNGKRR